METRIGLFDLDGSLADYEGALIKYLKDIASPEETPIGDNLWEMERQPHIGARMSLIKALPGFWRNLEPIENGMRVVEAARSIGYHINVLTKGPSKHPLGWAEKLEWCRKYLGEDADVHITMNKGLIYGTFLYDDFPAYMNRWLAHRPRGLGIMPVGVGNGDYSHPQVISYNGGNLDEVVEALKEAYKRPFGEPLHLYPGYGAKQ